jgi:hypothetical protein
MHMHISWDIHSNNLGAKTCSEQNGKWNWYTNIRSDKIDNCKCDTEDKYMQIYSCRRKLNKIIKSCKERLEIYKTESKQQIFMALQFNTQKTKKCILLI